MRSSILNKWRQSPLNMETFNKNKIFKVFQNPTRQEIMTLWIMVQRYVNRHYICADFFKTTPENPLFAPRISDNLTCSFDICVRKLDMEKSCTIHGLLKLDSIWRRGPPCLCVCTIDFCTTSSSDMLRTPAIPHIIR